MSLSLSSNSDVERRAEASTGLAPNRVPLGAPSLTARGTASPQGQPEIARFVATEPHSDYGRCVAEWMQVRA